MQLDTSELKAVLEKRLGRTEAVQRRLEERVGLLQEEAFFIQSKIELLKVVEDLAREKSASNPTPIGQPTQGREDASDQVTLRRSDQVQLLVPRGAERPQPPIKSFGPALRHQDLLLQLWQAEARDLELGQVPEAPERTSVNDEPASCGPDGYAAPTPAEPEVKSEASAESTRPRSENR